MTLYEFLTAVLSIRLTAEIEIGRDVSVRSNLRTDVTIPPYT